MNERSPPQEPAPATEFFAELLSQGFVLEARAPDRLWIAPVEKLDEETIKRVRAMKPALRAILDGMGIHAWPCVRCGRHAFSQPTICYWCRRVEERDHSA